jgi:aspartate aminotransferase
VISTDLDLLLAPLERFELIRRRTVRLGRSVADLSYANPYGRVQASAREAIREALDEERALDLQYTPFGGQTIARRAVADNLRELLGLPFRFDDVILAPGAMAALQLCLRCVGGAGDEVLLPVPCWLDYPLYVRSLGMLPVMLPLVEPRFDLDLDAIEAAVSSRTCAIVISQPANPTGRHYGAAALAGLGDVLRRAQRRSRLPITLVSDETHRDFVDKDFISPSQFFDRTLVVYSFGKYHFMQGQRLGYVGVSPRHPEPAVSAELVRWTRITGHATPTALMQRALPRLLALRHPLDWLRGLRETLGRELEEYGYAVVRADATLFMYVRTPPGMDDFAFAEQLAATGLLVLPAPVFHHKGYFRLALTASEPMIARAMSILRETARS